MSKKLCKEICKKMADYWWSSDDEKQKMHQLELAVKILGEWGLGFPRSSIFQYCNAGQATMEGLDQTKSFDSQSDKR